MILCLDMGHLLPVPGVESSPYINAPVVSAAQAVMQADREWHGVASGWRRVQCDRGTTSSYAPPPLPPSSFPPFPRVPCVQTLTPARPCCPQVMFSNEHVRSPARHAAGNIARSAYITACTSLPHPIALSAAYLLPT